MYNMMTAGELKQIINGQLLQGELSAIARGVSIDSRTIRKNNVFCAVKGEKFDGHQFVRSAVKGGAAIIIISKRISVPKNVTVIKVKDTTVALGKVAAWHRDQFDIPVIAVTGSAGKTTTKDLIAAVLSKRFKVLKNVKSENNHFGVPLTLLKLKPSHDIAVIEIGTNQPGDIRRLSKIVRPTSAVFTNIGDSHLEKLNTQKGVFKEKIQLLKYLHPSGNIIVNYDDPHLRFIKKERNAQKVIVYGRKKCKGYVACQIAINKNNQLSFKVCGRTFVINSPAVANVNNALAAISTGALHKIRYNEMIDALKSFRFKNGRQEVVKSGNIWLIDDSYNANPVSLMSAVTTLNMLKIRGKRIVVCADMLELGKQSKRLHLSAGNMIARSSTDVVLTFGRQARYITQCLSQCSGHITAVHCKNIGEIHRRLKSLCEPGDAVLVKGSRGMQMERTVHFLKNNIN